MIIQDAKKEYRFGELLERSLLPDPIEQFESWFKQALQAKIIEPNAMILCSVGADAKPSARTVLVREVSEAGFVFYTNYLSRKGRELESNPHVAGIFWWGALERQVRIEGSAAKLPAQKSDQYFATRERGSQIGAHASRQSSVLKDRAELERAVHEIAAKFKDQPIPRPAQWGGYVIVPERFEFWQGRANRLSDRLLYLRDSKGGWRVERLAP